MANSKKEMMIYTYSTAARQDLAQRQETQFQNGLGRPAVVPVFISKRALSNPQCDPQTQPPSVQPPS